MLSDQEVGMEGGGGGVGGTKCQSDLMYSYNISREDSSLVGVSVFILS